MAAWHKGRLGYARGRKQGRWAVRIDLGMAEQRLGRARKGKGFVADAANMRIEVRAVPMVVSLFGAKIRCIGIRPDTGERCRVKRYFGAMNLPLGFG